VLIFSVFGSDFSWIQGMSEASHQKCTADKWPKLIEQHLASGLTQKAFCEQHGVGFHHFHHRHQRSPLFAGKRRPLCVRRRGTPHQPVALGLRHYQQLYAIEREAKDLPAEARHACRQTHAVPAWAARV
jgi:hypothetical protein